MSYCSNSSLKPYKRAEVRIVFTDKREIEYFLPINLMNRSIDYFTVDGVRFTRERKMKHDESWEWLCE